MSKAKAPKAKASSTVSSTKATASKSAATGAHRRQRQGRSLWFWLLTVALPLGLLAGALYALTPRTTADMTPPLPTPTAAVAAVATATLKSTPVPPLGPADYCRKHPRFARALGFDASAYLTTSATDIKGMAMVQPAAGNNPQRIYQDPTWDDAGWLGHMTFDPQGNVFVFPAPRTSLIDNPPAGQNTLYRVDTDSAQLSPLLTITTDFPSSSVNPFGLLGTAYDCDTNSLYAATVAGSTAAAERGKLVRIDLATVAVVAELQGIDPFGLTVNNEASGKRLYFGAARTSDLYSIGLTPTGDFVGQPQLELALPEPTLKGWRIGWQPNGDMLVRATPFDFNLIATSERIDIPFLFRRDAQGLWQLVKE